MLLAVLCWFAQARPEVAEIDVALKAAPGSAELHFRRAEALMKVGWHEAAAGAYGEALRREPGNTAINDRRGDALAFLGRFDEAAKDFDAHIAAQPRDGPRHWRRGIALYWGGQHEKGRKQFEDYQSVDGNDVENVAFWWLCAVPTMGKDEASKKMPEIGFDRRVPLMAVDKLYRGTATPADVEAAIVAGNPGIEETRHRRFYGHLYLGLWHDALGKADEARKHLEAASVRWWMPGYMGEVARTHLQLLDRRGRQPYKFNPKTYEKDFAAFARQDVEQPFALGGVVFVGSSTIRLWKLERDFPGLPVLNRGFGGSSAPDVNPQTELLFRKHRPNAVVYYEGDNDLANGRSPAEFAGDVAKFLAATEAAGIPKVVVLGVKPSIRRWHLLDTQRDANRQLAALCAKNPAKHAYIDTEELVLGADGRPRPDAFVADGLHLSPEAYARIAKKLRPLLAAK